MLTKGLLWRGGMMWRVLTENQETPYLSFQEKVLGEEEFNKYRSISYFIGVDYFVYNDLFVPILILMQFSRHNILDLHHIEQKFYDFFLSFFTLIFLDKYT